MRFQWAFDRDIAGRKMSLVSERFPTKYTEQGMHIAV